MKKQNNQGAALYLVVVATSIAVTLLMIMYSKLSAIAINAIESINTTQEEFYLESARDMYKNGKNIEEIEDLFLEFHWEIIDELEEYLYGDNVPEAENEGELSQDDLLEENLEDDVLIEEGDHEQAGEELQ